VANKPDVPDGLYVMINDAPQGQLFSRTYLKRGEPIADSARMRSRLYALVKKLEWHDGADDIHSETGTQLKYIGYGYDWDHFFKTAVIRDVLDSVTLLTRRFRPKIADIRRIFQEENVHYTVDDIGGVHFFVDAEFAASRASALGVLSGVRYENVRIEFEKGYTALDSVPPDGKGAIRANFNAVECLFRLIFPSVSRLAQREVASNLKPFFKDRHCADTTASRALGKAVESFQEWVEAAHYYRHEPGKEEHAQPPLSLAIMMVSGGANWLRWLADVDQIRIADENTP
jgi:hypothetical protein